MSKPSLEERVTLFNTMSLPGQPMGMHMGTSYLVNDLWSEVKTLREMVGILEANMSEEPKGCPTPGACSCVGAGEVG